LRNEIECLGEDIKGLKHSNREFERHNSQLGKEKQQYKSQVQQSRDAVKSFESKLA